MTLEAQIARLEKRVRALQVLTITLLGTGLLFIGWGVYRIATVTEKWNDAMPPIARGSRHISVIDGSGEIHAIWSGSEGGWTIRASSGLGADTDTRPSGCTLDYRIVDGTPRLSMTDVGGQEVWHAP
jgi:hypothetical protein